MFGPIGVFGAEGAGLRAAGTNSQIRVRLSCNQSHGSPEVALSRSDPVMAFARPVATSATHNSIPFSFVFRNESSVPSGENRTFEAFACGGMVTFVSLPSEIFLRVMP